MTCTYAGGCDCCVCMLVSVYVCAFARARAMACVCVYVCVWPQEDCVACKLHTFTTTVSKHMLLADFLKKLEHDKYA